MAAIFYTLEATDKEHHVLPAVLILCRPYHQTFSAGTTWKSSSSPAVNCRSALVTLHHMQFVPVPGPVHLLHTQPVACSVQA